MNTYTLEQHRGLWWVIDHEGYEVSYVGYETKREAEEARRIQIIDDAKKAKFIARMMGE